MARAEEQLDRYREEITRLGRCDSANVHEAAIVASAWASFDVGFLMGAGLPEAAATVAHLFRRAYPGASFPKLWEGEA
jgi:hypothetical protein